MIEQIERLPEISFYGDLSLEDIKSQMVKAYQDKYKEVTGKAIELKEGEPMSLLLNACAVQLFQQMIVADKAGKMNFLKYSYGEFLDNLAALKGICREGESKASTTIRFTLSDLRPNSVPIPQGTRVSTADRKYFETCEYAEIPSGEYSIDVRCNASEPGTAANGLEPGEIYILVDVLAYIGSAENITASVGGLDRESDDSLRDRIYLAPANYAVAGPADAYEFFTKTAYTDICDVQVSTPAAGEVKIFFLTGNGEIPSVEIINRVSEFLNGKTIRPMTDLVTVSAPTKRTYSIDMTYYVSSSDTAQVTTIRDAVSKAVNDYINWQAQKIGRDINPSKLTQLCMSAGAKRVVIRSPTFTVLKDGEVAACSSSGVNYGGLEND